MDVATLAHATRVDRLIVAFSLTDNCRQTRRASRAAAAGAGGHCAGAATACSAAPAADAAGTVTEATVLAGIVVAGGIAARVAPALAVLRGSRLAG
ncbi:unnamed protein product [Closterium sp. NIES-54]